MRFGLVRDWIGIRDLASGEWTGTENGLVRRIDWYGEWTGTENGLVRRLYVRRLDCYGDWICVRGTVNRP
jgi:hypothetical protein